MRQINTVPLATNARLDNNKKEQGVPLNLIIRRNKTSFC